MLLIRQRFAYIKRTLEAEHLRAKLDQVLSGPVDPGAPGPDGPRLRGRARRRSSAILRMILQANEPTILEEESFRALMDLPKPHLQRHRRATASPS